MATKTEERLHLSQQTLRCGGCWLSSWTTSLSMLCIRSVVVGFHHGHLSHKSLRCGRCWLSSWAWGFGAKLARKGLPAGSWHWQALPKTIFSKRIVVVVVVVVGLGGLGRSLLERACPRGAGIGKLCPKHFFLKELLLSLSLLLGLGFGGTACSKGPARGELALASFAQKTFFQKNCCCRCGCCWAWWSGAFLARSTCAEQHHRQALHQAIFPKRIVVVVVVVVGLGGGQAFQVLSGLSDILLHAGSHNRVNNLGQQPISTTTK